MRSDDDYDVDEPYVVIERRGPGAGTFLVGLAIGALTSHDVWTRAERRSALALIRTRPGIGLAIRF